MKQLITPRLEGDLDKVSQEVTELLDRKPGILIRWGILVLTLIFLTTMIIAWNIKYPTITKVNGTLKISDNRCYVRLIAHRTLLSGVKVNQNVSVNFHNYPKADFGSLHGIVATLSNSGDNILCQVIFPDGLKTNSGKMIPPLEGLVVEVHLVNGNKRLVNVIFDRL